MRNSVVTEKKNLNVRFEHEESLAEHVAREHSRVLLAFLGRRLRSREEVEDLFQDILAGLISIEAHQVKAPLAYAMKCASIALAARYKAKKLQLVPLDEIGSEQMEGLGEDPICAVEFGQDLLSILNRLPRSVQREVYVRRLLHDVPFTQIAEELNVSVRVAYNYYCSVNKRVWELMSE